VVGHVTPEAADGGPIALVKDGDSITIDAKKREINFSIGKREMESRAAAWRKPSPKEKTGVLAKYAKLVSSASEGAVTDR